jgi:hypothetical protein
MDKEYGDLSRRLERVEQAVQFMASVHSGSELTAEEIARLAEIAGRSIQRA